MSRTASGTVDWRGNPSRWWARGEGQGRQRAAALGRPQAARSEDTPEDKKIAKRLALKRAKLATKGSFVGVEQAAAPKLILEDLEDKWFALLDRLLGDNGVSPDMIGMLDGHAAKSVPERHYMGHSLEAMARAVSTLTWHCRTAGSVSPGSVMPAEIVLRIVPARRVPAERRG
jgi:hypothetical protein